MKTINLRDYYYWYTADEFIEVSDDVAEELMADKRYEQTYERTKRRYGVLSLDTDDGIEKKARIRLTNRPDVYAELMEQRCRLCRALNSLPEKQGKRIEAYYILGISQRNIAKSEGVSERNVRSTIKKGLRNMKSFLRNFDKGHPITPHFCPDI